MSHKIIIITYALDPAIEKISIEYMQKIGSNL